jgi:hypothetical protein
MADETDNVETPVETPVVETPVETPEVPAEAETPADTEGAAEIETPSEDAPVDTPVETPSDESRTGFAEKGLRAGDACICPDGRAGTVHQYDAGLICMPNQDQG